MKSFLELLCGSLGQNISHLSGKANLTTNLQKSPWFACHITPGKEQQVLESIKTKGYSCLLPMQRSRRGTSAGVRETTRPLFAGYVFVQLELSENRMALLTTPNVRTLVSFGGKPAPLGEEEVKTLQRIVETGLMAESWPLLQEGNQVEMVSGPLTGLKGLLVSYKENSHLVVSFEMLQRSIAVKIYPGCVGLPVRKPSNLLPPTALI